MGDRGNIGFVQHTWNHETKTEQIGGAVFLYTHWAGYRAQELAKAAIDAAKDRWGDQTYATRIAVSHLTAEAKGDGGWGLGILPGENSYPLPMVDFQARTVAVLSADEGDSYDLAVILAAYAKAPKIPFTDFVPAD